MVRHPPPSHLIRAMKERNRNFSFDVFPNNNKVPTSIISKKHISTSLEFASSSASAKSISQTVSRVHNHQTGVWYEDVIPSRHSPSTRPSWCGACRRHPWWRCSSPARTSSSGRWRSKTGTGIIKAISLSLSHFASHDACMHVMKEGKETWSPRRAEGTTWAPALQQVTGDYNGSGEEERSTRSTACSGRGRLYTVPYNCEKGIQYNTIVRREYKDNASGKQLPVRECWTGSGRAGVAKISPLKLLTFSGHPEKCDRKSILFLIYVWCSVLILYVLKCFHLSLETNQPFLSV